MLNGINSLSSILGSGSDPISGLGGINPTSFGSVIDQVMAQAKTPADKAKVAFAQAQFSELNALAGIFSDNTSPIGGLGMGTGDIFGVGGPMGLPSWASDAQRVLGNPKGISDLIGMSEQASALLQQQFSHSLSSLGSLGTTGGNVDNLF